MAAVAARLFYWQIVNYQRFAIAAGEQHISTVRIDAPRGRIYASDGNLLVTNQDAYLLYAVIPEIKKSLSTGEK